MIGRASFVELVIAFSIALGSIGTFITTLFSIKKTNEVHTLVNARSDRQEKRIDQLTESLQESDVIVPPNPQRESK